METLLIIIGIITALLFLFRPTPQAQIMYIPIEIAAPQGDRRGCLLPIICILLLFLLLGGELP